VGLVTAKCKPIIHYYFVRKACFCQTPTRCEIPPAVNAGSRQAFLVLSLAIAGTARILAHCKIEEES
jgi:hypothetical protein